MIEVKNLTKRFGPHTAVDNISFVVNDGEIVGFLGPNGAGKTTTMNMMTGFISSTEGSVRINGFDILEEPVKAKKQLGYLPDIPPLYGDMTVEEYLWFVCDLKRVKKSERDFMIKDIVNTTQLNDVFKRLIKNLSKGYRQRVGLAQALVGDPDVLILDEPTSGLDPKQIIEMRDLIKRLGKKHTVILSSHILGEVSEICDRILIINRGKIVASDTTEELMNMAGNSVQLVTIKGDPYTAAEKLRAWSAISSVTIENDNGDGTFDLKVYGNEGSDIREIIFASMAEERISILMLRPVTSGLEEVFLKVINGSFDNAEAEKEHVELAVAFAEGGAEEDKEANE
ncbi:MAG: ABC transporter ATP-binding protein [Clostridia bacterium]|nr:ABC transporter ATP-binding protein [Clostridia bacterium]